MKSGKSNSKVLRATNIFSLIYFIVNTKTIYLHIVSMYVMIRLLAKEFALNYFLSFEKKENNYFFFSSLKVLLYSILCPPASHLPPATETIMVWDGCLRNRKRGPKNREVIIECNLWILLFVLSDFQCYYCWLHWKKVYFFFPLLQMMQAR